VATQWYYPLPEPDARASLAVALARTLMEYWMSQQTRGDAKWLRVVRRHQSGYDWSQVNRVHGLHTGSGADDRSMRRDGTVLLAENLSPRRGTILGVILLVAAGLALGIVELRAYQAQETSLRQTCDHLGVGYQEGDTVPVIIERAFPHGTSLDQFFAAVGGTPGLAMTHLGAHEGCRDGVMIWLQVNYRRLGLPSDPLGLYGGHTERYLCFEEEVLVAAWKSDPSYEY
jgi:hypothetical protein